MPVDSKHPDFKAREKDYELIADCLAGERVIKSKGETYLPKPNPDDTSEENAARYRSYKKRAVFHNVTGRTVENNVGQSFAIDPVATVPAEMEPWLADIDGGGTSAIQQSKKALGGVVANSRAFLWVDYPKTSGPVSVADAEAGNIRPKIILCPAIDVINWRVVSVGAKSKLSLVVIREQFIKKDDGFEATFDTQYRVLRLIEGKYWQELHRPGNGGFQIAERIQPLDGQGNPFDEIPGTFIGATANDVDVEKPLMLDIANLNIAHYRNSADYEEAVFMVGQPTPWLSGLSQSWVDNNMKGGIMLGSRACIPLPENAQAGLLQATANTLPKEAMDQKEILMEVLGAKLAERAKVQKTATEAGINEASETSILASCCNNVSAAYGHALRWGAKFANIETADPEKEILFELNTDFAIARMTPEEAQGVMALWQGELMTFEEARDKLKSGGWAYLDDEDAKDQLEEEHAADFAKAQQELKAQTDAQIKVQAAKPAPGTNNKPVPAGA